MRSLLWFVAGGAVFLVVSWLADFRQERVPETAASQSLEQSLDGLAEQIREAAMAESDPQIRDALWDEYRRHMGIKK